MTRKLYSWLYLSHNARHVHNAVYFWQLKDLQVGFKGVGIWDHDVLCRLGQVRKFGIAQTACRKSAGHIVSQICFHSLIRDRSCPFAIPVSVPTLHAVASYRKQVGQHGRKLFLMQCVFCSSHRSECIRRACTALVRVLRCSVYLTVDPGHRVRLSVTGRTIKSASTR